MPTEVKTDTEKCACEPCGYMAQNMCFYYYLLIYYCYENIILICNANFNL